MERIVGIAKWDGMYPKKSGNLRSHVSTILLKYISLNINFLRKIISTNMSNLRRDTMYSNTREKETSAFEPSTASRHVPDSREHRRGDLYKDRGKNVYKDIME